MKSLKIFAAATITAALAISLTACSPGIKFPFDDPKATFESPSGFGYGLSGDELPDFVTIEMDNIDVNDGFMMTACQHMEAFETGTVRNFSGEIANSPGEAKDDYRIMVLGFLEYLHDDYPETRNYYSGALAHLTDPDKQVENYDSFKKVCLPYLALVTRSIAEYREPISIEPSSCWTSGNPSNIRVALEKKVDDEWVEIKTTSMAKDSSCESAYPYSGEGVVYSPHEDLTTMRWHYTLKDGGTFNDGTSDSYDSEFKVDRTLGVL